MGISDWLRMGKAPGSALLGEDKPVNDQVAAILAWALAAQKAVGNEKYTEADRLLVDVYNQARRVLRKHKSNIGGELKKNLLQIQAVVLDDLLPTVRRLAEQKKSQRKSLFQVTKKTLRTGTNFNLLISEATKASRLV